jgi:hypothetical protein
MLRQNTESYFNGASGRRLAVAAVVALSLFLNAGWYVVERHRQLAEHQYAAVPIEQRFSGPSFPTDMPLEDRAKQIGLTRRDRLMGWLDTITQQPTGHTIFAGWVLDARHIDPSPTVVVFVNHAYAGSTIPHSARPDVINVLKLNKELSSPHLGFELDSSRPVCPPGSLIETLILSGARYSIVANPSIKFIC